MTTVLVMLVVALLGVLCAVLWKLSGPFTAFAQVQLELRTVGERIAQIERAQGSVGHELTALSGSVSNSVLTATTALQAELSQARATLAQLTAQAQVRAETDLQVAASVRRLETIIAGTHSKGAAGENILDAVFAKLPQEWQVRNFKVGNKVVEFGLRLPNSRILPIDSKWTATALLEQLVASSDVVEQQRLKAQIESTVLGKAREVRKYLDPGLTLNFGVAAVPDAVYDLCSGVQSECFNQNVVLVAYSMFIPYLLLVFQTVLKTDQSVDLENLTACLDAAQKHVAAAQEELEGRYARAMTMLGNSRGELAAHLGRINNSLSGMQFRPSQGAITGEEPMVRRSPRVLT